MKRFFSLMTMLLLVVCANVSAATYYEAWLWDPTDVLMNAKDGETKLYYRDATLGTSDLSYTATFSKIDRGVYSASIMLADDETTMTETYLTWYDIALEMQDNANNTLESYELQNDAVLFTLDDAKNIVPNYSNGSVKVIGYSDDNNGWNGNYLLVSDHISTNSKTFCVGGTVNAKHGTFEVPISTSNGEELVVSWADPADAGIESDHYGYVLINSTGVEFTPRTSDQHQKPLKWEYWNLTDAAPAMDAVYNATYNALALKWMRTDVELSIVFTVLDDTDTPVYSETYNAQTTDHATWVLPELAAGNYKVQAQYMEYYFYVGQTETQHFAVTLPDLNMHVLVHPDCGIDFSEGVWMQDAGSSQYELQRDAYLGEGWYTGTMPAGSNSQHEVYLCNSDASYLSSTPIITTQADAYAEIDYIGVNELPNGNSTPHDYRIVDLLTTVKDYFIHLEWTVVDIAYAYKIEIKDKDNTVLHTETVYEEEAGNYDFTPWGVITADYEGAYITIYPVNISDEMEAEPVDSKPFDLKTPKSTLTITKQEWNATNSAITVAWKVEGKPEPESYIISVIDETDNVITGIGISNEFSEYTLTIPADAEGKVRVVIEGYTEHVVLCASAQTEEKILTKRTLDNVKVHVLVTPDNGVDFHGNVYLWWNDASTDLPLDGKSIKMAPDAELGEDWYTATLSGNTTSEVCFTVMREEATLSTFGSLWTTSYAWLKLEEGYYRLPGYNDFSGRTLEECSPEETTHNNLISNLQKNVSEDGLTITYTWEGNPEVLKIGYAIDFEFTEVDATGMNEYTIYLPDYCYYSFNLVPMDAAGNYYLSLYDDDSAEPAGPIDVTLRFYLSESTSGLSYINKPMKIVVEESAQPDKTYDVTREGTTNWYKVNVKTVTESNFDFTLIFDPDGANYGLSDFTIMANRDYYVFKAINLSDASMLRCDKSGMPEKKSLKVTHADKAISFAWDVVGYDNLEIEIFNEVGTSVYYETVKAKNGGHVATMNMIGTYTYTITYRMKSYLMASENGTVTLTKADKLYSVTFDVVEPSEGIIHPNPSGKYAEGAVITVYAEPHPGYEFKQWSDGNTQNPRTITVGKADINLVAEFQEKTEDGPDPSTQVTLTVIAIGEGTTSITTGKYKAGAKVKIIATPKAGNTFLSWSSKSAVGTDNYEEKIIEIELNSDLVLAAIFADTNEDNRATFRAKVADDQDSWGSVKAAIVTEVGGTNYTIPVENKTVLPKTDDGIKVKVSATPAAGYKFLNWNNDSEQNEAEHTLTVKKNTTYTAYFKKNAEGVENVDVDVNVDVNKRIVNGMLIITRDGKDYTITGQRL